MGMGPILGGPVKDKTVFVILHCHFSNTALKYICGVNYHYKIVFVMINNCTSLEMILLPPTGVTSPTFQLCPPIYLFWLMLMVHLCYHDMNMILFYWSCSISCKLEIVMCIKEMKESALSFCVWARPRDPHRSGVGPISSKSACPGPVLFSAQWNARAAAYTWKNSHTWGHRWSKQQAC